MNFSPKSSIVMVAVAAFTFNYHSLSHGANLFGEQLLNTVINSVEKELTKPAQQPSAKKTQVVKPAPKKAKAKRRQRPQQAENLWASYKDWSASANTFLSGGGDWVTDCEIHTGGDGDSSIKVQISWGEPLPSVFFSEATARGYPTQLQGEQELTWTVHVGNKVQNFFGSSSTGVSESGIPFAENTVNSTYEGKEIENILRAFAKGKKVVLIDDYSGGDLYTGSLSGFTAAYRKMSEWCGFSVDKIL